MLHKVLWVALEYQPGLVINNQFFIILLSFLGVRSWIFWWICSCFVMASAHEYPQQERWCVALSYHTNPMIWKRVVSGIKWVFFYCWVLFQMGKFGNWLFVGVLFNANWVLKKEVDRLTNPTFCHLRATQLFLCWLHVWDDKQRKQRYSVYILITISTRPE